MECRRRVKEQQKRIGSAEFRNTAVSFITVASGLERFVSTPELHSEDAVAHSLLTVIYHVLNSGTPYYELGALYFGQLDPAKLARYHLRRLAELGYEVQVEPGTAA